MSDPSQTGISSAQLAAMQHGQQANGGKALFGIFNDTQGIVGDVQGFFSAQMGGILGQHKENKLLADMGIRTTSQVSGDVAAASYTDVYGTASSGSTGGEGGDGGDFLGRIKPFILVYGETLVAAGVMFGMHMSEAGLGGYHAPATGKGSRSRSDFALGA